MTLRLLFFVITVAFYSGTAFGQDTISLKNGRIRIGEVTEVGDDYVLFRQPGSGKAGDSLLRFDRTEVLGVAYKGGYREVFSEVPDASTPDRIQLVNAREIKGRILEVEEKNIVFKLSSYSADSIQRLSVDSVARIVYSNGYEEQYNELNVKTVTGTPLRVAGGVNQRFDTVRLIKSPPIVGYVTEIGDELISIAAGEPGNPAVQQVPKSEVRLIVYSNGYVENYALPVVDKNEADHPEDLPKESAGKIAKSRPVTKSKHTDKQPETPPPPATQFPSYSAEALAELPVTRSLKNVMNPGDVRSLDLSNNNLVTLENRFEGMNHLVQLRLDHNRFKEIPSSVFSLRSLYSLRLDNCLIKKLGDLPKGVDSNALAVFRINNNKLTSVDADVFLLPNLRTLDLSFNEIKHLGSIRKTEHISGGLQFINLSHNRLKELPAVIGKMPGLTTLDLSYNSLKSLTVSTLQKTKLENLNISDNPVSTLEPAFYSLKTLKSINLRGTRISTISDSVSKLSELTSVWLPEQLVAVPAGLKENKNLRELYLEGNTSLTSFPQVLLALSRLEVLSLNGTRIYKLPGDIGKLRRLKRLYLSNSHLNSVPPELFQLPRLQQLDLSGNNITTVPKQLGSLAQLEMVNLENSPVNGESLLTLKRLLPYASIKYYSPELGLNYESKPVPAAFQNQFIELLDQCEQGNTNACYELGRFFENNLDFGLAIKQYFRIAEDLTAIGSAQRALAYFRAAELYNDADNARSYNSIYKRRAYSDYADYNSNSKNNRALTIYCKLCEEEAADENAYKTMQQACAKAALIYNDLQKNLKKIYDFNRSEVERLVGGASGMANLKAGGDYLANTSTSQGQSVAGGIFQIVGIIGKSSKESKAERIQNETIRLKDEIEKLRQLEEYYVGKKP